MTRHIEQLHGNTTLDDSLVKHSYSYEDGIHPKEVKA